ncbi:hypothetical protein chiPu_0023113 [Chiloscyllium punctatum]|uniref:Uncharacterized protein n=1 Tax=Chiloscyllium punctatum TaxID=137246 RepID=A0A401T8X3_CHIPU|nr:hypothetical protein [Chiloscyllium punctatum]
MRQACTRAAHRKLCSCSNSTANGSEPSRDVQTQPLVQRLGLIQTTCRYVFTTSHTNNPPLPTTTSPNFNPNKSASREGHKYGVKSFYLGGVRAIKERKKREPSKRKVDSTQNLVIFYLQRPTATPGPIHAVRKGTWRQFHTGYPGRKPQAPGRCLFVLTKDCFDTSHQKGE